MNNCIQSLFPSPSSSNSGSSHPVGDFISLDPSNPENDTIRAPSSWSQGRKMDMQLISCSRSYFYFRLCSFVQWFSPYPTRIVVTRSWELKSHPEIISWLHLKDLEKCRVSDSLLQELQGESVLLSVRNYFAQNLFKASGKGKGKSEPSQKSISLCFEHKWWCGSWGFWTQFQWCTQHQN